VSSILPVSAGSGSTMGERDAGVVCLLGSGRGKDGSLLSMLNMCRLLVIPRGITLRTESVVAVDMSAGHHLVVSDLAAARVLPRGSMDTIFLLSQGPICEGW
jgi:hypothetical protein